MKCRKWSSLLAHHLRERARERASERERERERVSEKEREREREKREREREKRERYPDTHSFRSCSVVMVFDLLMNPLPELYLSSCTLRLIDSVLCYAAAKLLSSKRRLITG